MIPDRAPNTVWPLAMDRLDTNVHTFPGDRILVSIGGKIAGDLSRSDARLLAKRINECLDATVKR